MNEYNILLLGNPNVGKSSIFNILTGENQHTGNWIGKTVETKLGKYNYQNNIYNIYDLPGTYSLNSTSVEEEVTKEAILFTNYDLIIVVIDSTAIRRNLNLLFQILEYNTNVILCLNLIDIANNQKIKIDIEKLKSILKIDVIATSSYKKIGIDTLKEYISKNVVKTTFPKFYIEYNQNLLDAIKYINEKYKIDNNYIALKIIENDIKILKRFKIKENIINDGLILKKELEKAKTIDEQIIDGYKQLEDKIIKETVTKKNSNSQNKRRKVDKILTNKITGIPIMVLMLSIILFITIYLSNYPSTLLFNIFSNIEKYLINIFDFFKIPDFIKSPFIDGIYKTLSWVVSVMLPPMAIFFPLFSILEDLGYLPRVAFNLDGIFASCHSCGKQSLTMMMGIGCNAVGVTNARIIENKKQRLIAIVTNNLVPCNGRFPMIISLITMFLASSKKISVLYLLIFLFLSFIITLIVTYLMSLVLKEEETSFTLELPPFRKPQIIKTIIRSFKDKTLQVLKRAIIISIPAGLLIYVLANFKFLDSNLLSYFNDFLNPLGNIMGLDGIILTAFLLAFPANEIVIPIIIMTLLKNGVMTDIADLKTLKELLVNNGWTYKTAILTIIFSIFHFPCSTTMLTIYHETKSKLWTAISFILPTLIGVLLCIILNIIL